MQVLVYQYDTLYLKRHIISPLKSIALTLFLNMLLVCLVKEFPPQKLLCNSTFQLLRILADFLKIPNDIMKELLADKTAYCLRHTFATICQQYVRPDIVDIWMGDSPDRLVGRLYTHFSYKFMREQMDLVKFPL